MSPETERPSTSSPEQQEARAKLRENFLRTLYPLKGEPCLILTYEKSLLEATFHSWKPEGTEVLVQNLKTPSQQVMPSSILRTPDILAVQFNNTIL